MSPDVGRVRLAYAVEQFRMASFRAGVPGFDLRKGEHSSELAFRLAKDWSKGHFISDGALLAAALEACLHVRRLRGSPDAWITIPKLKA